LSTDTAAPQASTLRDYLQVARRRKWIIVQVVVLVPLAALVFSLFQTAQYQGSAQVLLSQQDLSSQLTGTQAASTDPTREGATQAALARVPTVAQGAIRTAHVTMTAGGFLAASSVSASATSDLLAFNYTSADANLASRLATAYARAYVRYRLASETAPIMTALKEVQARIAQTPSGVLYNTLVAQEQKLQELATLKTSDASVVKTAGPAAQTAPKTSRNVMLGIVLGLFLGIGLAFLREALDTRVRSAEVIGERLGLPLLARLPEPARALRAESKLAMLEEPKGVNAEAFRMLRTNLEFAMLGKDVRTLLMTSAVEQEGKSTTIANLAVALARAGQRVILVDLDLRRPFLDRFFGLRDHVGLTQVAIGHVPLSDALAEIELVRSPSSLIGNLEASENGRAATAGNGNGKLRHGSLRVLPSGPIPPDPGEFVGTGRLAALLEELRRDADIVLIDAPPLFHVGDAMVLSAKVDAVIVATRMEILRRPMLAELNRLLETVPAIKLGFVVTGAEADEAYGSKYGGYYYSRPSEYLSVERPLS